MAGFVTLDVLALEFQRDLFANLSQVIQGPTVGVATRHFRQISNESASKVDDVYLHIRLAEELSNVATAITAMIVLTIGNEKQSLLRVCPRLYFRQSEVNSIIQRRCTSSRFERQLIAKT